MSNYQIIGSDGKPIETDVRLHPGEVIDWELQAREILKKDFAKSLEMQPAHLSDLIKGKRHVSVKLALKLEAQLGIDADFWLRLQSSYDLFMARKKLKDLQAA